MTPVYTFPTPERHCDGIRPRRLEWNLDDGNRFSVFHGRKREQWIVLGLRWDMTPWTLFVGGDSASNSITCVLVHGDCRLTIHKASTFLRGSGMEVTSNGQYLIVGI